MGCSILGLRHGCGGLASLIVTSEEDRISDQNSVLGKVGSAIAYVGYLVSYRLIASLQWAYQVGLLSSSSVYSFICKILWYVLSLSKNST